MATDCEDQDLQTEDAVMPVAQQNTQSVQVPDIDYSEWGAIEKKFIICMASSAAFFSPLSSNIYYPIFNVLAQDLHVSNTLINVTVTTYLVWAVPICNEDTLCIAQSINNL